MRQYNAIKQQVPNALLMFRLGDFYELFFEDAVTAARELEITLTARNKEKGTAIPMCGVPYHAAEGYIARLIQKGYRVAICDQMEDPRPAKKLVRREITRIVTPGTATDATPAALAREQLSGRRRAVHGNRAGVAHVDVSTGEFRVTELEPAEVAGALEHLGAREVLFPARPAAAHRRRPRRAALRAHRARRLGLHLRLRRPHAARSLQAALARWLRPGATPGRRRRRRRDPALPARHPARRARPSRPPDVSTTAPKPWCSTPSPCAIWNWSSRCSPPMRSAAQPRCSACSIRPPPAWAAACCASACCALRSTAPKSKRASMPWANCCSRPSCAPNCASSSPAFSIWSACWPRSRSARAGPRDLLALGRSLEKIPALEALLRHPAGRAPAQPARPPRRAARRRRPHPRSHRRRAAAQPGRRRHDPRRLPRRTRRTARPQPERPAVHRADRSARARSAPASVAEGPLQQRLRLLHRNLAKPTCIWRPPITSASRRWSTPSASPRRS